MPAVTPLIEGGYVVNGDLAELYDFFGALRARILLICSCAVAGCLIMVWVGFVMHPVYRGFAVLAPVTADTNPLTEGTDPLASLTGDISQLTSSLADIDRDTDEAMTVLGSRSFTEGFIKDNDLLPVLFPKLWDAEHHRWKSGVRVPTLASGFERFDPIRTIDRDALNNFVTLQIDWPDRVQAAQWANEMADRLNNELRVRAIETADASLAFLEQEIQKAYDVETRQAISRLMESQIKKKMLANVTRDFELRFVDKAIVPDADFPLRPKKFLMGCLGFVFGALLGVVTSLLLYRRELSRAARL
jgi:hypothetical protein